METANETHSFPEIHKKIDSMLKEMNPVDKNILNAGCGPAAPPYIKGIAEKNRVHCIDIDKRMIEKNRVHCKKNSIQIKSFIECTAENMPFGKDFFDLVICSEVIEHSLKPKKILKEASRVLKPSGTLIVSTPNRFGEYLSYFFQFLCSGKYHDYGHVKLFSRNSLKKALMEEHFKAIKEETTGYYAFGLKEPLKRVYGSLNRFLAGKGLGRTIVVKARCIK